MPDEVLTSIPQRGARRARPRRRVRGGGDGTPALAPTPQSQMRYDSHTTTRRRKSLFELGRGDASVVLARCEARAMHFCLQKLIFVS
jgi:hypothetical protein